MIQIRESTNRLRVCESRAHPVFNQSLGGSFLSYAISVAFARWNFLLHAAKKNNNASNFFCVFEAKLFGRLYWRTIIFFSFKKRPNIFCTNIVCTLNIRPKYDFLGTLSLLIRPLTFYAK